MKSTPKLLIYGVLTASMFCASTLLAADVGLWEFNQINGAAGGVGPLAIRNRGINGPYVGSLQPNTWYRLGISVTCGGTIHVYTNGFEMGSFTGGAEDGFFAPNPNSTVLILADT